MHTPLLGQVIRFGVVGGICTALYAAVYLSLAYMALPPGKAVLAVAPAFAVAAAAGYYLHGAWSFRGHGSRDRPLERAARFLAVQAMLTTDVKAGARYTPDLILETLYVDRPGSCPSAAASADLSAGPLARGKS